MTAERFGPKRDARARAGRRAEAFVAQRLAREGWRIVGRNVRVGRTEVDLVGVDPGPPPRLVVIEVRSRSGSSFGAPEESVDRAKVARLYAAAGALRIAGHLPDGTPLPRLPWRVDLVAVDLYPLLARGIGGAAVRHLRDLGV